MSLFTDHPRARWAAPFAAVAVIAGGTAVATASASADPGLPPRSAAELLVDVSASAGQPLSGTVVQTSDLGIPDLSSLGGSPGASSDSGSSLASAVSGTHTWRVWLGGPTQQRLALVSGSGESDVIRNGSDVWLWSSQDKSAVHHTLSADDARRPGLAGPGETPDPADPREKTIKPGPSPTDLPRTPEEAAAQVLAALDPSTAVTTEGTATVAGRAAYELVLTPSDGATKVDQVRIAVDGKEKVPTRVRVYAKGINEPALEVGFTSVDFTKPDARQFEFTPPEGTTVKESSELMDAKASARVERGAMEDNGASRERARAAATGAAKPTVVGMGWSSVVVATLPGGLTPGDTPNGQEGQEGQEGKDGQQLQLQGLLEAFPEVSGSWGTGRLFDGTLFSAVLTDDGRIAVGAVEPATLYAALSAQ